MIDLFKKKNPKIGIYGLADLILIISLIVGIVALILTTTLKANASLILIFIVGILIVISRFIRGNRVDSFIGKYNLVLEAIISVFCFGIVPMVMTILTVGMNHYSTIVVCGIYLIFCIIRKIRQFEFLIMFEIKLNFTRCKGLSVMFTV